VLLVTLIYATAEYMVILIMMSPSSVLNDSSIDYSRVHITTTDKKFPTVFSSSWTEYPQLISKHQSRHR